MNQSVEVQALASTLDTETTTIGTVIGNRSIEDLPLNGRNYLQLADLVPSGTIYGPTNSIAIARGGGDRSVFQLNLAGQRLEYVHYTLDGIENTDPTTARIWFSRPSTRCRSSTSRRALTALNSATT